MTNLTLSRRILLKLEPVLQRIFSMFVPKEIHAKQQFLNISWE